DPDKGTWSYGYNALGLLATQTDAKGQVTNITYDILGRMTSRIDDAAGAGPQTSSWTYDLEHDGSNAKGKLTEISGPGNYFKYIFYDGQQRENRIDETIDGTVYRTRTSYDTGSRISTVTYPSSYVISNTYNA